MKLFLTSSPSGCPFVPGPPVPVLDPSNGFVDSLKAAWPSEPPRCLILSAFPGDAAANDGMAAAFSACFQNAGIPFSDVDLCDDRNPGDLPERVGRSGIIFLGGGHVPTQNAFFRRIGAAYALKGYKGIILGISAGTMNAAETVYAEPEEAGEAVNPAFTRWLPGLGLTKQNVLPHFEMTRDWTLDGRRLLEDIALPDSFRHPFIALPDGSWILSDGSDEFLFGEAWLLRNGIMTKICENGETRYLPE